MVSRFLLKDIALQAGVGTATVDRVLNDRGNVRWQTVERVRNAIAELERQSGQLALAGARLIIDFIVEAPGSFRNALDEALQSELPLLQPAAFRVRKDMRQNFPLADLDRVIARAEKRGSHGIVLMAPDTERVRHAIEGASRRGIPVVTLATDLPGSRRQAYVGLDNPRAGETAAWFFWRLWGSNGALRVLLTLRNDHFRGEEQRAASFRRAMKRMMPSVHVDMFVEGHDTSAFMRKVMEAARGKPYDGLYSVGGNNVMLLRAFEEAGHRRPVLVGHDHETGRLREASAHRRGHLVGARRQRGGAHLVADLVDEPDNRSLLRAGKIDLVIYHDLSEDVRNACRVIMSMQSRGRMPMPSNGAALRLSMPPMMD